MEALEFFGQGSYLKGGLVYADLLNTVSKTYAEEIQTPYFGARLDGLLRKRKESLVGIVNGIDRASYDPMNDPHIFFLQNSLLKKQANKLNCSKFSLLFRGKIPCWPLLTGLWSKGLELIQHVLEEILIWVCRLSYWGGEEKYRRFFEILASHYPEQLAAVFKFDEPLARKIYAASDMFLLPSRYEPCGTAQLIAMRYGSIPVVRETGGLKDTIVPFDENSKTGNGFTFQRYDAHDMFSVIKKALELYKNKEVWSRLVNNAVRFDSSWRNSAREYQALYGRLLER